MTTYYFIRHAEKESNFGDALLSEKGHARAKKWAEELADKGIEMIYCTPFTRTLQTAQPLLDKLGLEAITYHPNDLYIEKFKKETKGKTVLIVGHQDSTPNFVNLLLKARKYHFIESRNHANLYKVTIDDGEIIRAELSQVDF